MRRIAILGFVLSLCLGVLAPSVIAGGHEAAQGTDPTQGDVGSYIVVLDDQHPSQVAQEHSRRHGAEVSHVYRNTVRGYAAKLPAQAVAAIERDPRVSHVEPDGLVYALHHRCGHGGGPGGGGDGCGGGGGSQSQVTPWGIDRIGANAYAGNGAGVSVYVVDTGIDADHPDLAANLGDGFAATTCTGGDCLAVWDDDHGHGTHVAGTVGAIDNTVDVVGVAPQATLHAVKVLSGSGSGTRSEVIAGIDWIAGHNPGQVRVVNMSLGGSGSKTGTCTPSGFVGTDAYHQAICEATLDGAIFVVAAGNSGADAAGAVPAAYDDTVITVSATSCSQSGEVCAGGTDDWPWWSNWGDASASWTSDASAPVAIAAPGVGTLSTEAGGGTSTKSGTSMASPHVAGVVALHVGATGYSAGYGAFSQTRQTLLAAAESTAAWTNTSGNPHAEAFLAIP